MSAFNNDSQMSGYKLSNLTDEDLKAISEAEQIISRHHNSNQVLVAYNQSTGTEQSGARS